MGKHEKVEVLITANIRDCGEENEPLLREDLKDELEKCMKDFTGEPNTRKGMWFFLENVEHEVAFESDGTYEFRKRTKSVCHTCRKDGTPECKGNTHTFYKGVKVDCSGYEDDAHDE